MSQDGCDLDFKDVTRNLHILWMQPKMKEYFYTGCNRCVVDNVSENVIYVYSSYSKVIISTVLGLAGRGSYTGRVANLFHSRIMCYFIATKMLLVSGEVGKGQGVFFERGGVSLGILSLELQYFFF